MSVDPLGPAPVDPDEVRDIACDATASSSVCSPPVEPPEPPDFDVPSEAASGAFGFAQLVVILLVIALAALLAWLVYQFLAGRDVADHDDDVDEDLDATEDLDEELPRIIDEERPPDRWRRRAEEHRAHGEFRDSIRCEYRALVGDLARAGFVDEIPGRTSGEERSQVADIAPDASPVAARFAAAADLFDRAWFDTQPEAPISQDPSSSDPISQGRTIGRDDDVAFRSAADAVLGELLSRPGGSGR